MANQETVKSEVDPKKFDWKTIAAFLAVVVLGGSNAVAVRFSNFELPPFWGATLRLPRQR